ncbi:hypothetical protein G7069_09095 [Lysobacter sp. HDW10]|uniref:hypothetical protein n=1 Tax=Lysobacter sp. HDW10 TaxID=2714936 RepID=UPI001407CA3E|nr:hypothetical protein [Lysobacter sp. HDW10]QIK81735.1 hypothetical protein G7069_09095 [Lysobacter sp. HDW10]
MQGAPEPENTSDGPPNKGSVLLGFVLFLAILAANAILSTMIYAVITTLGMGYSRDALFLPALPVLIFVAALVILLAKRKTRTAWGMAVPFLITVGLIAFGLVATFSKLASLGIR